MKATLTTPTVSEQVIAFADLRGYHRHICSKLNPEETFAFLSEYYGVAHHALADSDGRIIKFIGDSILLLFPANRPRDAIEVLKKLKVAIDSFLSQGSFDSHLRVRSHVGEVAAGALGSGELERFDVCGMAVNQTALLPDDDWILSDELQRRIEGEKTQRGPASDHS